MIILTKYANSLDASQNEMLLDVRGYIESLAGKNESFRPRASDDVVIRTYLLDLIIQGVEQDRLAKIIRSLEHFYGWLSTQGMIAESPFNQFNFAHTLPPPEQLRNQHDKFPGSTQERDIARLKALTLLGELTNQISSVHPLLNAALKTIVNVMDIDTAWVSLKTDSGVLALEPSPTDEFILAGACNLPPALEQSDRHLLTAPPACHCQKLLNARQMKRAVNMVECTRLQAAARQRLHTNGLIFHASVPIYINKQPAGLMNFATQDWQVFSASDLQFLTAAAHIVSSALERAHLYDLTASQHNRMKNELKMAQKLQTRLLPNTLPHIPGMELAAFWRPSLEMSGDYYNIFNLTESCWGIVVADVCDKGAPAALYMAIMHSFILEHAGEISHPAALLEHVNDMLYKQDLDTMFVTAIFAIADLKTSTLTYATAGHPAPILRKANGEVQVLPHDGIALGVDGASHYKNHQVNIEKEDLLLFFTDGLTEACNVNGELLGMPRLQTALAKETHSARGLIRSLVKDLDAWKGSEHLEDDVTLIALRCSSI